MRGFLVAVLAAFTLPIPVPAQEEPVPAIQLVETAVGFEATEGGRDPGQKPIHLKNGGDVGSSLQWTATTDQPWLTVIPSSGTLTTGSQIIHVRVNATYQVEGWVGATSTVNAPSPRRIHSAAWAANQMVIWGGSVGPEEQFSDGGRYDPLTDTWIGTTTLVDAPMQRQFHTAVWTGGEMIVWGGWRNGFGYMDTGARYFPDQWLGATSTVNAAGPREAHSAVWTGSEMIVWGGWYGPHLNTGGRYDPVTDTWTGATSTVNTPQARQEHVAVWTGSRMIVWGGRGDNGAPPFGGSMNTGGMYDPATDTWTGATSTVDALSPRINPSAVWTGREMIVWGGYDQDAGGAFYNTGKRYDPSTNTWLKDLPTFGAPSARMRHRAVWTGKQMIVWGGQTAEGVTNTGAIYQPPIPAMGSHTATITISAPGASNTPQTVTVQLQVAP